MKSYPVKVESKFGRQLNADLIVCETPGCEGTEFQLFVIRPLIEGQQGHNHIQCCKCGTSFCQGEGMCQP